MRAVYFLVFLFTIAAVPAIGVMSWMMLDMGVTRYEWMVEHSMNKHSYAYAGLLICLEIVGLLLMRRGVMYAYECFCVVFPRKENESVSR